MLKMFRLSQDWHLFYAMISYHLENYYISGRHLKVNVLNWIKLVGLNFLLQKPIVTAYFVSLMQDFIIIWVEVYLATPVKATNNYL